MRVFIPKLGSKIRLSQPWEFELPHWFGNRLIFELLGLKYNPLNIKGEPPEKVSFPIGSEIIFNSFLADDIIRLSLVKHHLNNSDDNTITFLVDREQVNSIEFE